MAQTTAFPEELRRRWPDILKAAAQVGGWFDGYVEEGSARMGAPGVGRRPDDEGDFPSEPPIEVPVFDRGPPGDSEDKLSSWSDFEHKGMYATFRDFGRADDEQAKAWEFNFGSFSVFRVTAAESKALNEGYEDSAGTENERLIEDGGHVIVVYMK